MSLTDEQYEELKTQLVSSLAREYEYRRLLEKLGEGIRIANLNWPTATEMIGEILAAEPDDTALREFGRRVAKMAAERANGTLTPEGEGPVRFWPPETIVEAVMQGE